VNHKHVEIDLDRNIFDQIIESIAADYGEIVARVPRLEREENTFYFTIITESYLILEVTLSPIANRVFYDGLPAFETEVKAY
jgi:hypothetical protein